jgi:hypothetical protein
VLLVIAFSILVKLHGSAKFNSLLNKELKEINARELESINGRFDSYNTGKEFLDTHHLYAYDLDIFGEGSLFQFLNRTAGYTGALNLSDDLAGVFNPVDIEKRQHAIRELSGKLDFRQKIYALNLMIKNSEAYYTYLTDWGKNDKPVLSKLLSVLSFISPSFIILCFIAFLITGDTSFWNLAGTFAFANIVLLLSQFNKIKSILFQSSKTDKILALYSKIVSSIEAESFSSEYLLDVQSSFKKDDFSAQLAITKLSALFGQLDNVQNPFGAFLFNAFSLYHFHVLRKLDAWKKSHGPKIEQWLSSIGTLESLSSFANFSYNHPNYVFPSLAKGPSLEFIAMGHPLIQAAYRVDNDISFNEYPFVILTGSNMSGKSTFLRALGVNLVLCNAGSVVCAQEATIHPMPILASMRMSDSLKDQESYFFAEVKRLKTISDAANEQVSFVILDEILRGTNSDDKREGTIRVIERFLHLNAIGLIATHDLKVCETKDQYPDLLTNKCFEVEIISDNLSFDYKLREGVCKNKSASFLMGQMGII